MCTLLGRLKLVVSESRRAVNGEGNGAGTLLIVVDDVVDDDAAISSIVVSRPSKKWMRSGTALVKVSSGIGGRSMELLLLTTLCIMDKDASDGQLRLEANVVW